MAIKPIQILINAKDNASAVFTSLQAKIATVGAAIVTYFGINAFAGVVKGAADFEGAMSRVKAATGATKDEMALLTKAAQDASTSSQFSSIEAAGALENLAKAGLSAKDSIGALPSVLALAAAGDISLAESSEIVTKAASGMGIAFSETGRIADVLALGANATNTSVKGLAEALSYAAPTAQALGLSLESTVAMAGKMADAGIDASRAGTALGSVFAQFKDPASAFRLELANAGIVTNNFEQALHQLAAAGPRGEKALIAVGLNAGPGLRALLNQGMPALDELKAKLLDAGGSAEQAAKTMQDNLNGSMQGLGSVWQTVKDVFATPVLPVIKQGVDELAGALRTAVSDGTIARFGAALGTAFQNGMTWIREFVGSIDFTEIIARAQQWADETGAAFSRVSEWATNTGNAVSLAWNVMAAGFNTVLAIIFKVGSVFAEIHGQIALGVSKIAEYLSKISFGGVSAAFKAAATEIKIHAGATGEAADALAEKANEAFDAAAASANRAQSAFSGLSQGMSGAASQSATTSAAIGTVAAQLQKTAEATAAARVEQEKKTAKDAQAKQALVEHNAALAEMRAEYERMISEGNTQRAAELIEQINKKLRETPAAAAESSKAAAEAALALEGAFTRLGVTSAAVLKTTAENAKRDFLIVRDSGVATAEDIAKSFAVYAEKAIAANKGVVSEAIKSEAAIRGVKIETDDAGKSTVTAMNKAAKATEGLGDAARSAKSGFVALGQQIEYTSKEAQAFAAQGQMFLADLAERNHQTANSSIMNRKERINPIDAVPSFETQEQAEAWFAEWDRQYQEQNPMTSRGGALGPGFGYETTKGEWNAEVNAMKLRNAMKVNGNASESTQTPLESMRSGQTITINLNTNGSNYGQITTDAAGAETLRGFMSELERNQRKSGR